MILKSSCKIVTLTSKNTTELFVELHTHMSLKMQKNAARIQKLNSTKVQRMCVRNPKFVSNPH